MKPSSVPSPEQSKPRVSDREIGEFINEHWLAYRRLRRETLFTIASGCSKGSQISSFLKEDCGLNPGVLSANAHASLNATQKLLASLGPKFPQIQTAAFASFCEPKLVPTFLSVASADWFKLKQLILECQQRIDDGIIDPIKRGGFSIRGRQNKHPVVSLMPPAPRLSPTEPSISIPASHTIELSEQRAVDALRAVVAQQILDLLDLAPWISENVWAPVRIQLRQIIADRQGWCSVNAVRRIAELFYGDPIDRPPKSFDFPIEKLVVLTKKFEHQQIANLIFSSTSRKFSVIKLNKLVGDFFYKKDQDPRANGR